MKVGVVLQSAFEALIGNPLRSVLTMLGIIIGVASVMAMMSVSEGARQAVEAQINAIGASNLTVRPGASRSGGRSGGAGAEAPFNDDLVRQLEQEPYVEAVAARVGGGGTVVAGEENWSTNINGANVAFFDVEDWDVIEGELFTEQDVQRGATVAVIGTTIADTLFPGTSPIGQRMRVRNVPVTVIGVLESKGQSGWGGDQDDVVFLPISTARNRVTGAHPTVARHVSSIEVRVAQGYDMERTQELLENRLRELRGINPGDADDFRVFNIADFVRARDESSQTLRVLLAFTAAVSLLVGGVGVMNIMLVSVTERTREIGLRMAIGARKDDILLQFLAEALLVCFIGALIGSGIAWFASGQMEKLLEASIAITPFIASISVGAAVGVGVVFGFFPAWRASRLNPIEALRHE